MTREILTGILITILFHMILAMLFLSFRMNEMNKIMEQRIVIDLQEQTPEEKSAEQKKQEENEKMMDKMYDQVVGSSKRSNMGVNLNDDKLKENISTEEYVKKVQTELGMDKSPSDIGFGNKGSDKIRTDDNEKINDQDKINESKPKDYNKKDPKRVIYKGPTNIFYDLGGRYDVDIIVPVYKCEGSGKVVVDITVNQSGNVVSANINRGASIDDDCFTEAAYNAATHSTFNADSKAPDRQKGMITYLFVPQKK